ncbi:MAG: phosphoribosylanthranilate isomerase [Pseudomonadota bacterium]
MALWIKICGLRNTESIDAAIEAGADAVGFVFAPSPREVTLNEAAPLVNHARGRAEIVAVMRHPRMAWITEVCACIQPDWLQSDAPDLHGVMLAGRVTALPVYRDDAPSDPPPRLLFEGADSGTGDTCDWSVAAALSLRTELILAGGLNPENVTAGITAVRPFGVDVSSGVERTRGRKDPNLIFDFVQAARAAA